MKIFNWILKAFDFVKGYIEIIKTVLIVAALVSTFISFKSCSNQKESKQNFITIAKNNIEQIKTISGNHAIEKKQWNVDRKELEQNITKEQAKQSEYLSQLQKANTIIKDLNIKNKRLETYNNTILESKDSIRTEFVFLDCDNVEIKPIKKEHIAIDFKQNGGFLDVMYVYNAEISTIVYLEKNKDQFFLWRWINPDWISNSASTCNDPNANITNHVSINFD